MTTETARHAVGRVAVIGAGTMGAGIAQVAAMAGHETRIFDADADQPARACTRIEAVLGKGVQLGKVTEALRDETLARLQVVRTLNEAVRGADLVIEAVPESMPVKRALFAAVEEATTEEEEPILATNTSSLSVTAMAAGLRAEERVLGLHFFNPVHIMALVEVVRGEHTAPATLERALRFVRGLGKEPIVVTDSPGFASSRLGVALGLEAIRMVEAGVATPHDIDRAMVLGYRHPMGPLRLTDLVGLDVRLGIARYLHSELDSESFRPPALLEEMVARGHLGRKSGHGFYRWKETEE